MVIATTAPTAVGASPLKAAKPPINSEARNAPEPYNLDVGDDEMDEEDDDNSSNGSRRLNNAGRHARIPIASLPGNPFLRADAREYTREEWSERRVALITGITGQDGSYLAERE